MKELDFLAIREHWLSPNEFVMLSSASEDVMYCALHPLWRKMQCYLVDHEAEMLFYGIGRVII